MDIEFVFTEDGGVKIGYQSEKAYNIGLVSSVVRYDDVVVRISSFPEANGDVLFLRGGDTDRDNWEILYPHISYLKERTKTFIKGIIALIKNDFIVVMSLNSNELILNKRDIGLLDSLITDSILPTLEIYKRLSGSRKICKI